MRRLRYLLAIISVALLPALCRAAPETELFGAMATPKTIVPSYSVNFMSGKVPSTLTFARTGTAWYFNSSGLLASVSGGTPRFDYGTPGSTTLQGLLLEAEARTNAALYSRDFTQSGTWTLTNITAALTATGIDGVANSASLLTATANNGTACQSVALTSAAHQFSLYIKRVTGSGAISLAPDGSTYTTATVTGSYTRSTVSKTAANPQICIKFATSGDAVNVDVAQLETGSFPTSPIITTNATATRNLETLSTTTINFKNLTAGTIFVQAMAEGSGTVGSHSVVSLDDTTTNNRVQLQRNNASSAAAIAARYVGNSVSGVSTIGSTNTFATGSVVKMAMTYSAGAQTAYSGGSSFATGTGASAPNALTKLEFGSGPGDAGSDGTFNGWLQGFRYWSFFSWLNSTSNGDDIMRIFVFLICLVLTGTSHAQTAGPDLPAKDDFAAMSKYTTKHTPPDPNDTKAVMKRACESMKGSMDSKRVITFANGKTFDCSAYME